MSDGLTLFPVNRNISDLCLVIKFTHSHTTCIGRAQRDVIYRAVMYACPAKLPGPKETSGTEKDTSVFSLFWHYIPLCILPVSYITWASDELHVGFDLWAPHLHSLWSRRLVGLYPIIAVGCWRLRGWSMLVSGTLFYSSNIWMHQRSERIFLNSISFSKLIDGPGSGNWVTMPFQLMPSYVIWFWIQKYSFHCPVIMPYNSLNLRCHQS